jgi:hypothetical protein
MTRTVSRDESLKTTVGHLWGTQQRHLAPQIHYQRPQQPAVETNVENLGQFGMGVEVAIVTDSVDK